MGIRSPGSGCTERNRKPKRGKFSASESDEKFVKTHPVKIQEP